LEIFVKLNPIAIAIFIGVPVAMVARLISGDSANPPAPVAVSPAQSYVPQPSTPVASEPKIYRVTADSLAAWTEEDLKDAIKFANRKDSQALAQLVAMGKIFPISEGAKVYLEECAGFICSTIKARFVGKVETFYTVHEAIENQ
jgi:hypothetical protein